MHDMGCEIGPIDGETIVLGRGGGNRVLEVRNLRISIGADANDHVVDGIDLDVSGGETLCIVGESGCGKSVTALSLMGLTSEPINVKADTLRIGGIDMRNASEREMARHRGSVMAMVFQEPMTSLNPAYRVGSQIAEMIVQHQKVSMAEARGQVEQLLAQVGIADPRQRMNDFPHQLSGGMRQRVMIAMALSNRPRLLIADEPTTALDVTIQRQILVLINRIKQETGTSVILITHDLGVVAQVADRVAVMYAGRFVESAPVDVLFSDPRHPYTLGLLSSIPRHSRRDERLVPIEGSVPAIDEMPDGCRFSTRCPFADARCFSHRPPVTEFAGNHRVECWKLEELGLCQ